MFRINKFIISFIVVLQTGFLFSNESYIKLNSNINNFYLVLDQSGSMKGSPMDNTIKGALTFIENVKSTDNVGVITFGSRVKEAAKLSTNKSRSVNAVKSMKSGGQTLLYDGIATAIRNIRKKPGNKIILFLTDGSDSGSAFGLRELYQMNSAENIFVYGIGLGNINHKGIRGVAEATGGHYSAVTDPFELNNIYSTVLNEYYKYNNSTLKDKGQVTVKTMPSGVPVYINDIHAGNSPVTLRGIPEGNFNIKVKYEKGIWEKGIKVMNDYRTVVESSVSEVPGNLTVESIPGSAAVFIDGTYVGMTDYIGSEEVDSSTLKVKALPAGVHTIKVIVAPDQQISAAQSWEFEFEMENDSRQLLVNVFQNKADFDNGEEITRDIKDIVSGSLDAFDKQFGNDSFPTFSDPFGN